MCVSFLASWIRMQPTKINAYPCGSGSTTLEKYTKHIHWICFVSFFNVVNTVYCILYSILYLQSYILFLITKTLKPSFVFVFFAASGLPTPGRTSYKEGGAKSGGAAVGRVQESSPLKPLTFKVRNNHWANGCSYRCALCPEHHFPEVRQDSPPPHTVYRFIALTKTVCW